MRYNLLSRVLLAGWLALAATPGAAESASAPPAAASSPPSSARAERPQPYFDTSTLDLVRLLPPPPATDSAGTRAELHLMEQIQSTRTGAQASRAKADAQATIYRLADALGHPPGFAPKNLPLTDALFRRVLASELAVVGPAKRYYGRPRPFVADKHLKPLVPAGINDSYPSGHSSWVHAVAIVLADMVPERRAQLMARADEYAHNRVVAGVHYPSDVEAGKLAGTAIAVALYVSPGFRADLAAARSELRRALGLPEQPPEAPRAAPAPAATR